MGHCDYTDPDVGTLRLNTLPNFWNNFYCDHLDYRWCTMPDQANLWKVFSRYDRIAPGQAED